MRLPVIVAASLVATPALAAPAAKAPPRDRADAAHEIAIPPELSDPAMGERVGRMVGALASAMMNLPIGEIEAAAEGRPPTAADRRRTVRDVAGGPDAEQRIVAQAQTSGVVAQAATKAIVAALPSILDAMQRAEHDIERATANLPDPNYPRR